MLCHHILSKVWNSLYLTSLRLEEVSSFHAVDVAVSLGRRTNLEIELRQWVLHDFSLFLPFFDHLLRLSFVSVVRNSLNNLEFSEVYFVAKI